MQQRLLNASVNAGNILRIPLIFSFAFSSSDRTGCVHGVGAGEGGGGYVGAGKLWWSKQDVHDSLVVYVSALEVASLITFPVCLALLAFGFASTAPLTHWQRQGIGGARGFNKVRDFRGKSQYPRAPPP